MVFFDGLLCFVERVRRDGNDSHPELFELRELPLVRFELSVAKWTLVAPIEKDDAPCPFYVFALRNRPMGDARKTQLW
jgi:hypothetical protein